MSYVCHIRSAAVHVAGLVAQEEQLVTHGPQHANPDDVAVPQHLSCSAWLVKGYASGRCRANMAHITQSTPYYGRGCQVKVIKTPQSVPSSLVRGVEKPDVVAVPQQFSCTELVGGSGIRDRS